jgi:nitroimidazol reductase NimA-like FMN-containing flavoprotein (pyridoxamine 5'-phosphate oxidase superfamily)
MPTHPEEIVVTLDDAECRALLLGGRIGRVAFTRNALPAIQPVSYRVHEDDVVIPVVPDSRVIPRPGGAVVAFGIDSYDDVTWTGWSVMVVGPSRAIDDPAEVAVLDALPWPLGGTTRDHRYVAVRIGLLSGWRTGTGAA